jgi:alpha-galactosidase
MWSILAAPLMISDDLDTMTARSAADSANSEVIAIDQDPAGVQGTLAASAGNAEVWVKPLSDGSRAVALLNRGNTPLRINASALGVGLERAARYTLRDVWAHRTTATSGTFGATVPGNGTALYRIAAVPRPAARSSSTRCRSARRASRRTCAA